MQLFISSMGGWVCPFSWSLGWDDCNGHHSDAQGREFTESGLTRSHDTFLASWCFALTSIGALPSSLTSAPDWPMGPRSSPAPVHLALCPAPSPWLLGITAHLYFWHPVKHGLCFLTLIWTPVWLPAYKLSPAQVAYNSWLLPVVWCPSSRSLFLTSSVILSMFPMWRHREINQGGSKEDWKGFSSARIFLVVTLEHSHCLSLLIQNSLIWSFSIKIQLTQ